MSVGMHSSNPLHKAASATKHNNSFQICRIIPHVLYSQNTGLVGLVYYAICATDAVCAVYCAAYAVLCHIYAVHAVSGHMPYVPQTFTDMPHMCRTCYIFEPQADIKSVVWGAGAGGAWALS